MKITFLPENKTMETDGSETLLDLCRRADISIDSSCGGSCVCGKCKIQVLGGNPKAVLAMERATLTAAEIRDGFRLACLLTPEEDMTVQVPRYVDALTRKAELSGLKRKFRVSNAFAKKEGSTGGTCFGLSFDVGTTTVVGMLWDLVSGELLAAKAEANPQAAHGADVISRIMFAGAGRGNLLLLCDEIAGSLSRIAGALVKAGGVAAEDVRDVTVVGNTTMSHLLVGVDPGPLAVAPFQAVFREAVTKEAAAFGIAANADANVTLLPNIAGHVGSDITAGILASGIMRKEGAHLMIDVGTNGEIVLCADGKALACSTAAGPAFEGATIYQGMRAASGAIERVDIGARDVSVGVIGDERPSGICGSGILDAVAALVKIGLADKTGRLLTGEKARAEGVSEELAFRLREGKTGREFALAYVDGAGDVVVTQKDIREVQLAKAAIRAGITLLLKAFGLREDDLRAIYIAGAFGSHIRSESAVGIGLIPDIGAEKIVYIGNAAGIGASMALLSAEDREEARQLAEVVRHVELAEDPLFQDTYLDAMGF